MTDSSTDKLRLRRGRLPIVIALAIAGTLLVRIGFMLGVTPPPIGLVDGRLRPCPSSPNCVCSEASDSHAIAPLRILDDPQFAWMRLKALVSELPRTRVVTSTDDYLHVEFTTALMRFVDDVEFLLDAEQGVIEVRSASRIGHSDLGTNRKRVESIRKMYESDLQIPPLNGQATTPPGSLPESP